MIFDRISRIDWKKDIYRDNLLWLLWAVLYAFAFPVYNLSASIWFIFIPVFVFAYRKPIHLTVKYAFFYSLLFFVLAFFWIYGFWWGGVFLVFPIYAIYYAFFFFCIAYIGKKLKAFRWVVVPMLWISNELLRSTGYHGFEWNHIGHSQWNNPFMIQSADLFGVWGISFLILLVNAVLAEIVMRLLDKGNWKKAILKNVVKISVVLVLFLLNLFYGINQYKHYEKVSADSPKDKLVLIQDSIWSWDPIRKNKAEMYNILWKLNAEAATYHPDMIVWSETMINLVLFYFIENPRFNPEATEYSHRYIKMPKEFDTPMLITAPALVNKKYYNSGYYLDPKTNIAQFNAKVHLVPFGEWMPFYDQIPPFRAVMDMYGAGHYSPYTNKMNVIKTDKSRFRLLVCYEDSFPLMGKQYIDKKVNYFVNCSDVGWAYALKTPHPHWQHLATSIITAITLRRPIARATKTGATGVVDITGKFTGGLKDYERGVLPVEVPIIDHRIKTFFVDYGYLFPYVILVLTIIAFGICVFFCKAEEGFFEENYKRIFKEKIKKIKKQKEQA